MRTFAISILLVPAASHALAQQWEFGALGGGQFLGKVSANAGSIGSNATAGFAPGAAFGVFVGNSLNRSLGGEIHYEYFQNDLHLVSGGQTAQFAGIAHSIHYDVVYYTQRKESNMQFFAALGVGMKLFRGAGVEQAYQPLSQLGYFTKTQAIKPMIGLGGGFNYRLSSQLFMRAEVSNFITPFPTPIITPAPGIKFGSLLQDLTPKAGLSCIN